MCLPIQTWTALRKYVRFATRKISACGLFESIIHSGMGNAFLILQKLEKQKDLGISNKSKVNMLYSAKLIHHFTKVTLIIVAEVVL